MILAAGRVFDGERFHARHAVTVRDGRVLALEPAGPDARWLPPGTLLAPGFVDLQVNGGGGAMLNDAPSPGTMRAIARAHAALGTTTILPTLISGGREAMRAALAAGWPALHLEGPFLNPARRGIHPASGITAMTDADAEMLAAAGGRLLLTLAPEMVAPAVVRRLADAGVVVCLGHTEATAEQCFAALDAGARGFTHLFNAMSQLGSRAPGAVGAALARPDAWAGIIADGHHVHPAALRAAYAAKGSGRLCLVSDAMATVGSDRDGFALGGTAIRLRDGRLTGEDGRLAGAHLDMATAVRRMVALAGVPLADALRMATATPAAFVRLPDVGRLGPGCRADMVALDADLAVAGVWLGGVSPGPGTAW